MCPALAGNRVPSKSCKGLDAPRERSHEESAPRVVAGSLDRLAEAEASKGAAQRAGAEHAVFPEAQIIACRVEAP